MSSVKQILSQIGIKILSENGDSARFCPSFRGSDGPNAIINLKTGKVKDFVTNEYYSLGELVEKVTGKKLSKEELKKYGSGFASSPIVEEKQVEYWNKDSLLQFLPNHTYWLNRGISKETLDFFQGGVSHGGDLYQRYVWPVFERHGRIIGFIGRDLTGKYEKNKKYINKGPSSSFLFGLYNVQENTQNRPVLDSILDKKEVILVEGASDSVTCYDEGVKNVLPIIGLNISKTMMSFLLGVNPNKITLAYNKDETFRGQDAAVRSFAKLAEHFDVDKLEIKYPIGNDLADNKKDITKWLTLPPNNALMEFRNKFKRVEENKKKKEKGLNKTFTKQEIKIGKELAK